MTVMVVARLTIILYVSCKVCCNEFSHVTAAATYHLDSLGFENILGTLAHITGKYDYDSHLAEYRSYSALSAASFWRSHLTDISHLIVNDIKDCIEVIIHASISSWYCYLHNISSSLLNSIALFI